HLHRYQYIAGHTSAVVYSRSPLCYSFSEAGQQKKVVIIDIAPNEKPQIQPITLHSGRPLLRRTFDDVDAAVEWLCDNPYALVELTMISDTFMSDRKSTRLNSSHVKISYAV